MGKNYKENDSSHCYWKSKTQAGSPKSAGCAAVCCQTCSCSSWALHECPVWLQLVFGDGCDYEVYGVLLAGGAWHGSLLHPNRPGSVCLHVLWLPMWAIACLNASASTRCYFLQCDCKLLAAETTSLVGLLHWLVQHGLDKGIWLS